MEGERFISNLFGSIRKQAYKHSEYAIAITVLAIISYLYLYTDESLVTISSLLFSGVLALLYTIQAKNQKSQTRIMDSQTRIMEKQYQPELLFSIEYKNAINAELVLKNVGDAPALNVEAEWNLNGQEKTWNKPIVESGDTHHFPILVEDGWVVNADKLKEKLDGEIMEYVITCENVLGEKRVFDGSMNIKDTISGREGGPEIDRGTPVEELTEEVSDLVDEVAKVGETSKEVKEDLKLNLQSGYASRINSILQEEDRISLMELRRRLGATGISTSQIRNYIVNLERSDVVELKLEEDSDLYHKPENVDILPKFEK